MDFIASGEGIKVLGLVQVPQHGGSVFTARGAEGAVRGDSDCVDVAGVADVVGLDAAGSEFPDLYGDFLSVLLLSVAARAVNRLGPIVISALVIGSLMARRL